MAAERGQRVIGCTQATEIMATPGVALAGALPGEFALATTYSLGVCAHALRPREARGFAAMLTSKANAATRDRAGFECTR
jgi:molybdate transport system substrate-binding protein